MHLHVQTRGIFTNCARRFQHVWNSFSLNCSIVVLADDAVVTWGPSPTYGELMYGEGREKSSTNAKEVKPLEGILHNGGIWRYLKWIGVTQLLLLGVTIKEVACGFAHTLLIAKDTTEKDRELLAKLPKWPWFQLDEDDFHFYKTRSIEYLIISNVIQNGYLLYFIPKRSF